MYQTETVTRSCEEILEACSTQGKAKVKVKVILEQATMSQRGSNFITLLFL
jgi:hypothetical protein